MSKPKLPNLIGGDGKTTAGNKVNEGRLETDALPIANENAYNVNNTLSAPTNARSTSTVTESILQELSDPNYNSMEAVESITIPGQLVNGNDGALANTSSSNTMNMHNAQQQVVMNFSNANNLHFGAVYNFNQNLNASAISSITKGSCHEEATAVGNTKRPNTARKTTTVVIMMQSQEEPNHRLLDTIATHLGEGWKQVMRDLGHSEGQIEQAIINHQMHGNIKEVIYQLLLQWLRNAEDGEATVGRITTLLWESNHRECVQRMKLVWKALEKRKISS